MSPPLVRRRDDGLIEIVPAPPPPRFSFEPSPISLSSFFLGWAAFLAGAVPMPAWYLLTGGAVVFELWRGRAFFIGDWPPSVPAERRASVVRVGRRAG
jgi:hypothetical protein